MGGNEIEYGILVRLDMKYGAVRLNPYRSERIKALGFYSKDSGTVKYVVELSKPVFKHGKHFQNEERRPG